MSEREFSGTKLEWWAAQASSEALALLVGGELAHWRYRSRFVIENVVNGALFVRSLGGDPERHLMAERLVAQEWRLFLGPDQPALAAAIEAARPPAPPVKLQEAVARELSARGIEAGVFGSGDDAMLALLGRILWEQGKPADEKVQHGFFRTVRAIARQVFPFGEEPLRGWLDEAEKNRGGRLDYVRRLRLSAYCRWGGCQHLAEPVSAFVDASDFSLLGDARLELQLLTHRAALLLDIQDPMKPGAAVDMERRRDLVRRSRVLLARAAPLQAAVGDAPEDEPALGIGLTEIDPFTALERRARFAAHAVGLPLRETAA